MAIKLKPALHYQLSLANNMNNSECPSECLINLSRHESDENKIIVELEKIGSTITFSLALKTHLNSKGNVVYEKYDDNYDKEARGVYIVVHENIIVYCGKYTRGFTKRWLYTRSRGVYHTMEKNICKVDGGSVSVFAAGEYQLQSSLGLKTNWVNVSGIEDYLLRIIKPRWNSIGLKN